MLKTENGPLRSLKQVWTEKPRKDLCQARRRETSQAPPYVTSLTGVCATSQVLKIALRHPFIPMLFFLASDLSPNFAQQSFYLWIPRRIRTHVNYDSRWLISISRGLNAMYTNEEYWWTIEDLLGVYVFMHTCEVYLCVHLSIWICSSVQIHMKARSSYQDIFLNCISISLFDPGSLTGPGVLDFGWAG